MICIVFFYRSPNLVSCSKVLAGFGSAFKMSITSKLRVVLSRIRYSRPQYQCRNPSKKSTSDSYLYSSCFRTFSSSSPPLTKKKIWLYALAGVFGGAAVGAGYSYYKIQQARIPVVNEGTGTTGIVLASKPDTAVSRKVKETTL